MTSEEKYALITKLDNQEGILVTYSHPDGVCCNIVIQWDGNVDDYLYDILDEEVDIDEFKAEIKNQICIWDGCHESDIGILYCTADDIEIIGNHLTINCKGEHVYGSMTEIADSNDEIEFGMYIPFTK